MAADEQAAVVAWLESPAAHGGEPVTRIDTHTAFVFLAGDRAWKLKRAVHYDYVDFSTRERRRAACAREVELNAPAAPAIYRGVAAVMRRPDGSLGIGGSGEPVDWLVEMNRFDDRQLFDRLAARQQLDLALMRPLAIAVARFHATAAPRPDHGGQAGMTWVVNGNAEGFARFGGGFLDPARCRDVTACATEEIARCGALLEIRRAGGMVRQCHGDLHLRNLVLLDGRPTLFDAVEFNDEIACVDVLYDLAFLLMDLWRRELPRHANVVWNSYVAETGDHSGLRLMPLFLSCRAAVRAKTSATAARFQATDAARRELERAAGEYLVMAQRFLRPARPSLLAIGGFSGSGKSTLAATLAPSLGAPPGAVVVRSDEIRKRLCGVSPLDHLGPEGYTPALSRRVYGAAVSQAAAILAAGSSVIVDAVFARPDDRAAIEAAALAAGVPFRGIWLDAPEPLLVERLRSRHADVSDADASVLRLQAAHGAGDVTWARLDASLPAARVAERAACLGSSSSGNEQKSSNALEPASAPPAFPH